MYKKLLIALLMLLAVTFMFTSAEAVDEPSSSNSNQSAQVAENNESSGSNIGITGQSRGIRQVYFTETTERDRQQYYSPGRQIVYAGYYNPSCDYVYMSYSWEQEIGATTLKLIHYAIFDWVLNDWDYSSGGAINISPPGDALGTNIDVSPRGGHSVVTYQNGASSSAPWYTSLSYLATYYCPADVFLVDSCPGAPNYENIMTGAYCYDDDPNMSPYIWPRIDIDIDYPDENSYIHVAAAEDTCEGSEEVASLVYYRKVTEDPDETWTGTWEGPFFMDSSYIRSAIVRSDKDQWYTSVYYAYLKPIYYDNGTPHPCEASGFEHYYTTNEVVYKYSYDEGETWSEPIYVTDYASQFETNGTEPACYDLSALVDPNGMFHIVWSTANRDPDDYCSYSPASKIWHWDNLNNCISLVYDASYPANFTGEMGKWNLAVAKHNISYCDDKWYITFTRFGAHPTGDWSYDAGLGDGSNRYENGDIMVVASDPIDGDAVLWTSAVNLTDTESPDCVAGDCFSEHWPTMAMYSTDSLMIEYIEDKDPGAWEDDPGSGKFDNPVMFLTYPCFAMSDIPVNAEYFLDPDPPNWENVEMAPFGDDVNCPTPAIVNGQVFIENRGNIDLSYNIYTDASWLNVVSNPTDYLTAGAGPKGADDPSWSGADVCGGHPAAIIEWEATSFDLPEGTYEGTLTIDFDQSEAQDTAIHVSLNVVCTNYQPPAEYVRDEILGGSLGGTNLWMTPGPLDNAHVVRNIDPSEPDIPFPYESGWLVMIDDHPDAYWGHPCRWVFVNEDFSEHTTPLDMDFYPTVFGDYGAGEQVTFECVDMTSLGAEDCSEPIIVPKFDPIAPKVDNTCLYAVLISGGWRSDKNIQPFKTDLTKIYNILRTCGYPKDQIFVYYGNNEDLDLDGQAGSEVTGSATQANIRGKIQDLCTTLTDRDILFIFTGNHGINQTDHGSDGILLWDFDGDNQYDADEVLTPSEFSNDTENCTACRVYSMMVQCYSGKFLAHVGDGNHANSAIYAAAGSDECAYSTGTGENYAEYLAAWDDNDPAQKTMNEMHTHVTNQVLGSTPAKAEGTAGLGDNGLCECCETDCQGKCGDPNYDDVSNVSDAVYIINYVFVGGGEPQPVLACGDANGDGAVNVSDAVSIINYIFVGGAAPGDCSPGSGNWYNGDCCPFTP